VAPKIEKVEAVADFYTGIWTITIGVDINDAIHPFIYRRPANDEKGAETAGLKALKDELTLLMNALP
jgi:hypothetical protein